ncbi:MAG: UvrB/UvrC motif-containing protein [Atribacterota bacterium]|nr:UvrB/UvrC motif-containing protein [Atribacterota bacterium]
MLCQMCKKNKATVKIVKVAGLSKTELNVCNECANYLLGNTITTISFTQNSLNEILFNLLNTFSKYSTEDSNVTLESEVKCSNCGMTYAEFVKSGKLGCSNCYSVFRKYIKPLLNRLHGNYQHSGKIPDSLQLRLDITKKIKKIKDELKEAVSREEYEKAAKLRDTIIDEEKKAGIRDNE